MIKKIINFIEKNLFLINIFIIISASIFYYSNYKKFDTYITYKTYDFESRKGLFFAFDKLFLLENIIDTFLSDIHFSKSSYDPENEFFSGEKRIFKTTINLDKKKLEFAFNTKKKGLFNKNENTSSEKHKIKINNFVNKSLDIYHEKLINVFYEKNRSLNQRIEEISNIEDVLTRKILLNDVMSEKRPVEQYMSLLDDGKKLIMIKSYDSKFRRVFLNTDEFLISSLILLILFNVLVKNYNKILK